MSPSCAVILASPNTPWNFCPNTGAADAFVIFFAITTIAHIIQGILYKKLYCSIIVISGLMQTLTYIFRVVSIKNPGDNGPYTAWFVLILISPLFTNAFVYMAMSRMIWNFVADAKIYRVPAWWFSSVFVCLDIFVFIIQVIGAAAAAHDIQSHDFSNSLKGLHVYMVGVGIQQGFILLFLFFAVKFHRTIHAQARQSQIGMNPQLALFLLYALYAALLMITIRIIFRIIEYSQGLLSSIPNHEVYQYCLDSLPMLLALVLLNVVHPGRVMKGKESNILRRKDRKAIKGRCNKFELQALGSEAHTG